MDAGVLLMSPPYPKRGIDAVCAISTEGCFLPGVQCNGEAQDSLVAVVFRTPTEPTYVFPEEAVWHVDVPIHDARIIPLSQALALFEDVIPDEGL